MTIPGSVQKLGEYMCSYPGVFSDCKGLVSLTICEGVTEIGSNEFEGCSSLTNISIPASVSRIGLNPYPFSKCPQLTAWNIHPDNPVFWVDGPLVLRWGGLLLRCLECASGTVTVSEGVRALGHGAFYKCDKLTHIVLPVSVTKIDHSFYGEAFCSCPKLVICAPAGSYAQKYAEETDHPFVAL